MSSRFTLLISAFVVLCAHVIGATNPKPNVLFIAVDDLRPELGAYGVKHIKSPNIDRLAASGVRFDHAYVQMAICGPSRACLLTGLRPGTLKIEDIDTFFRNTVPDVVTLPQLFKQNGYTSAYVGKVFHPGQTDDAISWSRRIAPLTPRGESPSEYQLPESRAIVKQRREDLCLLCPHGEQGAPRGLVLEGVEVVGGYALCVV